MMVFLRLCLSIGLCSLACSELITLTDENFDAKFAEGDWLVKFYAPWCKHCKTLKPIFAELGKKVSHAGIGEIDATSSKVTAKKYNVTSFPTIIYRQDGIVGKYDGQRSMEGLTAFLDRLNSPSCVDITSTEELNEHSAFSDNVTFVLVHPASITSQEQIAEKNAIVTTFKTIATKLKQHASFAILAAESNSELGKLGRVSILKVEPRRPHVAMTNAASATAEDIEAFVAANNYPLVSRFDNHNFKRLSHIEGKYLVAAVVDYARTEETAAILGALELAVNPASTAAAEDQARFIFGHLDGVKWRAFIKHHRTMVPSILVLDQANDLHQTFPLEAFTAERAALNDQVASIILGVVHSLDMKDHWIASETPGLFEKLIFRFKSYYPYSILVVALPVLFFVMAMLTPYPQEKKAKQH
jgi:protein disulfide-isomerase-like protein